MQPRIELLSEKKLVGKHLSMSLMDNKTVQLWQSFIPRKKEIQHTIGTDLYAIQIYTTNETFKSDSIFEKWATIEVDNFDSIPPDMESFILPSGLYAVFTYKGMASAAAPFFQSIFMDWLPKSAYKLDARPHFEVLGAKYKNNDPSSEEEIWIPIK